MAKPQFQDIVPPDKRSIKRIPVPERARQRIYVNDTVPVTPSRNERPRQIESQPVQQERGNYERNYPPPPVSERRAINRPSKLPRILFTLIALIIIFGAGFWFVTRVSGANVIITPKQETVSVNAPFTASTSGDGLQFQTVTIVKDGKLGVAATGQEFADVKASGVIIIYNTTSIPQKLVASTRFQTPEGLIFRISDPVTVPAQSGSTPGSVSAKVTADATGPQYNVGVKDFTIPGFKGDPKYSEFYARTDPQNPIQGGFSGNRPKVDDTQVAEARTKVRDELKANLIAEAGKDIPQGFIMPGNSYYIEYESLALSETSSGAEVNERATFHGLIFPTSSLAHEIALKANGTTVDQKTDMIGGNNLKFTLINPTTGNPWAASTISFTLQGTTTLVSIIDSDTIKNDLAGKPRKSLNAILAGYTAVSKAQVTMRPFWKSTFPTDKNEITVTVTPPELSP